MVALRVTDSPGLRSRGSGVLNPSKTTTCRLRSSQWYERFTAFLPPGSGLLGQVLELAFLIVTSANTVSPAIISVGILCLPNSTLNPTRGSCDELSPPQPKNASRTSNKSDAGNNDKSFIY